MNNVIRVSGSKPFLELPAVVTSLAATAGGAVVATFAEHPPMLIRERNGRMYMVPLLPETRNVSMD
jgi:hypothetical protein